MAWGWCASSVPGSAWHPDRCRREAALARMDSPDSRPGGGPVSGALSAPLGRGRLLCRNGASERESSSCGGQAARGTCCAHGSSRPSSQGMKMCLVGPCVGTYGLLGIAQQSYFLAVSLLRGHDCSRQSGRGRNSLAQSCWAPCTGMGYLG